MGMSFDILDSTLMAKDEIIELEGRKIDFFKTVSLLLNAGAHVTKMHLIRARGSRELQRLLKRYTRSILKLF